MSKIIPAPKPRPGSYRARRALKIAQEIRNKWPDYVPGAEATRLLAPDGIKLSTFRQARQLIKLNRPDLEAKVLADEISLWRAIEIATKGHRVSCPTCGGSGHIFKIDDRKSRQEK